MDLLLIAGTVALGLLGVALFFMMLRRLSPSKAPPVAPPQAKEVTKTVPSGPACKIFFGSQTGTAESFATKLCKALKAKGMSPTAVDMEDYHADGMEELEHEPYVVFLMATHGEGDPTDNAIDFTAWLTSKEREDDDLKNVKFSVFGLGNRQYDQFNKMGKDYDQLMEKMGATRIGEYGEGDDDEDLEDDFKTWMAANVPVIAQHFMGDVADTDAGPVEMDFELTEFPEGSKATPVRASTKTIVDNQMWLPATLTGMRELQDKKLSGGRSTLHVEISGPTGTSYTS